MNTRRIHPTAGPSAGVRTALEAALRQCRRAFVAAALFSIFINALLLVVPIYSLQVFDRVLGSRSLDTLYLLTFVAVTMLGFQALVDGVRMALLGRIGAKLEEDLRGPVLASMVRDSARTRSGSAQSSRDLVEIRNALSSPVVYGVFDVPWAPLFLLFVFFLHPVLGFVGLGGAAILIGLAAGTVLTTKQLSTQAAREGIAAQESAQSFVANAEVVQAMGMLPAIVRHWDARAAQALHIGATAADRQHLFSSASKFVRLLLQVAAMGTGAALVLAGELTAGGMIAGSIVLARALAPIEQTIGGWRTITGALQAYRRLNGRIGPVADDAPSVTPRVPAGRLVIDRVAFVVPGRDHPVLRGINFTVAPGESIGLIGPSGSGKSTLAKILVGVLAPTSGTVAFDGAFTTAWRREDMGPHVGYLPQDVQLFPGTVRDNIARYTDADGDAVLQAAGRSGVHDLILQLPRGYDTEIGPGGVLLSSGQQQRVGLARAVFGDPVLIVLDEPDANLDPTGHEALFQALLACRKAGKTLILVTHRPALLSLVDRVILMRDGMMEQDGPRDEVLARLRPGGAPQSEPQGRVAESGQGRSSRESVGERLGAATNQLPGDAVSKDSQTESGKTAKPAIAKPEAHAPSSPGRRPRKPLTITQVEPPPDLPQEDRQPKPTDASGAGTVRASDE